MKTYKAPPEMVSYLEKKVMNLDLISDENINFTIFQDYVVKHDYGIPSGVVTVTNNRIYPGATPDLGCGFRVIKLKGVSEKELFEADVLSSIEDYLDGKICGNTFNYMDKLKINDMARCGHDATRFLFKYDRDDKYENSGHYAIDAKHELESSIFNQENIMEVFSRYQGHFLELLSSSTELDTVYVLIHTGSFMLADWFRQFYYPKIAVLSLMDRLVSYEDVVGERFYIPSSHPLYEKFYNDALALINFSIAYRDVIENDLIMIISSILNRNFDVEVMSDLSHTNLTIEGDRVIHQRGVQKVLRSESKKYIIAGNYGVGSMLFLSTVDQYVGHGVQVQVNEFHEYLEEHKEDEVNHLISPNLVSITDKITVDNALMAKINYDYYLNHGCILSDYLIPFYSYKERK